MVVAGYLEADTDRQSEAVQIVGKAPELDGGVEQHEALAALPAGDFDENLMTQLGDVDGYQKGALT